MYIGVMGFMVAMTIGCILKKILQPKKTSGELLWLVIYNDLMSFLCFSSFWLPSPGYKADLNKPYVGYLPIELIVLTGMPLIVIGICLKMIFYNQNKEAEPIVEVDIKPKGDGKCCLVVNALGKEGYV